MLLVPDNQCGVPWHQSSDFEHLAAEGLQNMKTNQILLSKVNVSPQRGRKSSPLIGMGLEGEITSREEVV